VTGDAGGGYGTPHHDDEIVEFGAHAGRRRQWLSRLLVACFVIAVAVGLVVKATNHKSHQQPQFPLRSSRQFASPVPIAGAQSRPPTVVNIGHPLLGVTAGWELFARGPTDVVAIQMARGQITETHVPALQSGNPEVSFVVGAHEALVRSPDNVPGYLIPDGRPAQLLTGPFANGGQVIPGPKPDQAWVMSGTSSQPTATLVTLAGAPAGKTISFNTNYEVPATAEPDGHGYLLVVAKPPNLIYDLGPTFSHQIADQILAVGPTRFLALACHSQRCRYAVINPSTGSPRVLPGVPSNGVRDLLNWPPPGVVSPDGSTAAVLERNRHGQITVQLLNLRSGALTTLNVAIDPSMPNGTLVWSPDSKWLFIAGTYGRLLAWNVRTMRVHDLGVQLPDITQVAIRPAAG
jgi:hypothetical protein